MAPYVSSGHRPKARLAEFQISPAAVATTCGQVLAAPLLGRRQRAPAALGELLVGLLPAGRGDDLAVDQLGAGAVAGRAQGLQHLGAELAGLLDDGADGVLVHTFEHAAFDQLVETRRGLERLHDVVYWSLVGHGPSLRCVHPPLTFTAA